MEVDVIFAVFSIIAIAISCLLLVILCITRRNRQRAVIWAAPVLMISLASIHLFFWPSTIGLIVALSSGPFIFIAWMCVYLRSLLGQPNYWLYIVALYSIFSMPWFFLYLAVKIYNDYRGRGAEHVKRVWEEALGC